VIETVMLFRWVIDFPGTSRPMDALFVDETRTLPDLHLTHGQYVDLGEPERIAVTVKAAD
jgi:hypothetical protein